ncbi:unnamed protein product, partial [marine sediment metagenome]
TEINYDAKWTHVIRQKEISELREKGLVWSGLTRNLLFKVEDKMKEDSSTPPAE